MSPQSLHHTFAIRTLREGAGTLQISRLLGHSSVATTQTNVDHLATAELHGVVPALPGFCARLSPDRPSTEYQAAAAKRLAPVADLRRPLRAGPSVDEAMHTGVARRLGAVPDVELAVDVC